MRKVLESERKRISGHKRTFSKTAEDLLVIISTPTGRSQPLSPSHLPTMPKLKTSTKIPEKKAEKQVSEEESHIRNLISMRKQFSSPSFQDLSPIYPIKAQLYADKSSFNSSTTAFTSLEENGVHHMIEVLDAIRPAEFLKIRGIIIELLEKSPEPHFAFILDWEQRIRGIYYVELASGYFHKVVASNDLPMVIGVRKVGKHFNFEFERGVFVESNKEKFDAVVLK